MYVGDRVTCNNSVGVNKLDNGLKYTIDDTRGSCGGIELHFEELPGKNWYKAERFTLNNNTNSNQTGVNIMNNTIRKVFSKDSLEVAEKVQAHFGHEIDDNFTGELNLENNKQKYLDEIDRREKEQEAKAYKAMGGDIAAAMTNMASKASK